MPKTPRNIPTRMSPRSNTHYRTTSMNRSRPPSLLLAEHESEGDIAHETTRIALPGLPQNADYPTQSDGARARQDWLEAQDFNAFLMNIRIASTGEPIFPPKPGHISRRLSQSFSDSEYSKIANRITELKQQHTRRDGGGVTCKNRKNRKNRKNSKNSKNSKNRKTSKNRKNRKN